MWFTLIGMRWSGALEFGLMRVKLAAESEFNLGNLELCGLFVGANGNQGSAVANTLCDSD